MKNRLAIYMADGTSYPLTGEEEIVEISEDDFKLQFCQDGESINNAGPTSDVSNELEDENFISCWKVKDVLKNANL